jgi:hypothetical protein
MTAANGSNRRAVFAAIAFTVAFAILGLRILDPEALISIDAGIKLLQAQALRDSGLASVAIPYPAADLDPQREFAPFTLPFVFERGGTFHGVYPLAAAATYAPVLTPGLTGTVLISVVSSLLVMLAMVRLAGRQSLGTVVVLAVCTPFWAYGVLMWEHMPALACSTWAWVVLRGASPREHIVGGLLLGVATALRPETLLLAPGLVIINWQTLHVRGLVISGMAFALPLIAVGTVDGLVYGRTPFAHVMHAVDAAWRLLGDAAPVARPPEKSLIDQARIVVGDWLVGIRGLTTGLLLAGMLIAAHQVRARIGETLVLVTLAFATVLALRDVAVMWATPELLAGLFRNSPGLLLALLPWFSAQPTTKERKREFLAVGLFVAGTFATRQYAGVQIGPRFLVPLLPLLAKMTADTFDIYRRAARTGGRMALVAGLSVGVLAGSVAIQFVGNLRAVKVVNHEGTELLQFVRQSRAPVVVISNLFLINHLAPEYSRTRVMRALNSSESAALSQRLSARGLTDVLTIDRIAPGAHRVSLPDFSPVRSVETPHARATLWRLTRPQARSTSQLSLAGGVIP